MSCSFGSPHIDLRKPPSTVTSREGDARSRGTTLLLSTQETKSLLISNHVLLIIRLHQYRHSSSWITTSSNSVAVIHCEKYQQKSARRAQWWFQTVSVVTQCKCYIHLRSAAVSWTIKPWQCINWLHATIRTLSLQIKHIILGHWLCKTVKGRTVCTLVQSKPIVASI